MMRKEQSNKEGYWLNELRSLGITPNKKNDLNDKEELIAFADNIKQVYYQEFKTAYDESIDSDDPKFDRVI